MQALLPNDIAVKRLGIPSDAFNIVKSPHKKLYRYQIWNSSSYVDPFLRPFIWHIPWNLDVGAMQKAAHAFVGTHDFTSFAASDGAAVTKTREILSIEMSKMDKMLVFDVEGTGFLKQMVRNLIGTLVEIGEGKRAPNCIPDIIAQEDRTKAGRTAAASGLTLERVHLHKKDLEDIHWM
jgi:tRNA pseudouridine38-40 synthase